MRVRLVDLGFAFLLMPLVLAGYLSVYFVTQPPKTRDQFLALAVFVGVPLYFGWIILHYTITKARRHSGPGYSHAFLSVLVVAGYIVGLVGGYIVLKG
jgi:hypothetical protein